MRLIGMLDSPYVRRVAVSAHVLGLTYAHEGISVLRQFDQFAAINPVVKAPTLVTDAGTVLMDSGLILDHLEKISGKSLMPSDPAAHEQGLRVLGLALAACEKSVSIVYEGFFRPDQMRHQPWVDRVSTQMKTAYRQLEQAVADDWFTGGPVLQPAITSAVAWRFSRHMVGEYLSKADHPRLAALSARAEETAAFRAADFS